MNNEKRIALISLGCPKNLVNSEEMLALLDGAGYALCGDPNEADAVIINTCGFIGDAKEEAISTILECAAIKEERPELKIIVTGCLSQRYRREMRAEMPEVDAILGTANYQDIVSAVERTLEGEQVELFTPLNRAVPELPRLVSTAPRWAYFRIAEGCDNHCAFCIIPALRGPYRSRSMESLLEEAKLLAESGIKELIVVAQDITRYGEDLFGKPKLAALLKELCKLDFSWIRLHYLYPEVITDELIDVIAGEEKIVKYLDIPIQHINDEILRRMNRHTNSAQICELFKKLRERIPGLVLRTSLIAGLPGEGEAEFEELCEFLREARIERAGIFPYSPEEGTPAAKMEDRCDEDEARRRADLVMELQAEVMDTWYESFIGKEIDVFVQGYEDMLLWGRSYADSPDIDGRVLFGGWAEPCESVKVHITAVDNGEWIGQQV